MRRQVEKDNLKLSPKLIRLVPDLAEQKQLDEAFRSPIGKELRKLLVKFAEYEIHHSLLKTEKEKAYEIKCHWSEFQADHIGFRRALRIIKDMLEEK